MRVRCFLAILAAVTCAAALAHPAPNSSLRLQVAGATLRAEYWLPVSELGLALAGEPGLDLPAYLLRRMSARTPAGDNWTITVKGIRADQYLEHEFVVAELQLAPPAGRPLGSFVLTDDVITHEIRNHRLYVVWNHAAGNEAAGYGLIGSLQYPERRLEIRLNE
jgi:hypothetical protein